MKVFVSIDLEGCSGVFGETQIVPGERAYAAAREHMQGDLEAALDGCFAAGAEQVVVCDAHDRGANIRPDTLPPGVSLVNGGPDPLGMMAGIDASCDAAVLVGYHAMAGTRAAVLDHTFTYKVFRVRVDDMIEAGELGLNAAVAGAFGVPVVFASGDDKLAAEAEALLPGIATVMVKEGLTRTSARLLAAQVARERIREGVGRALRAAQRPAALVWDDRPLRVVFTRSDFCDAAAACPGIERVDARTVRIDALDYLSAYRTFVAGLCLAATVGPS